MESTRTTRRLSLKVHLDSRLKLACLSQCLLQYAAVEIVERISPDAVCHMYIWFGVRFCLRGDQGAPTRNIRIRRTLITSESQQLHKVE
jgi:hypothetical protein